jgi:starvation-inducible DNA-binding protein
MAANIGIVERNIREIAADLSKLLADEYVLYTKTRNAHWNIEGPDFYDKHKFFEAQSEQIDGFIDSVAERIRSLGQPSPGTLVAFLENTQLREGKRKGNGSQDLIKELLLDHEAIIQRLRSDVHRIGNDLQDVGTSDFITGLMEEHEKMAWFLRCSLGRLNTHLGAFARPRL